MNISILLDDASLFAIGHIKGVNERLNQEIETALDDVSAGLRDNIPSQMNWKNPTGALAGSFQIQSSAGMREIGSGLPYAKRREFGFSGMTDSLGRTYTNDPGGFYMQAAVQLYDVDFIERVGSAIDAAL